MKFLCLHGAIGSPQSFRVQLGPLMQELESDGSCSFAFAQGKVAFDPPKGFDEYFGPGPHYKFLDDGGRAETAMVTRIRDFPPGDTAEDSLRQLFNEDGYQLECMPTVIKDIWDEVERVGGVDGIIGYSEGAMVAATVLVDQERRFRDHGEPRRLKIGVFFTGWPPLDPSGDKVLLSDETEERIDVPSVHVIGSSDPFAPGAIGLSAMFDEDSALLFDHGKGHTIPRDTQTVKELADAIRRMAEIPGAD